MKINRDRGPHAVQPIALGPCVKEKVAWHVSKKVYDER